MEFMLRPWQLFLLFLASWIDRQQQMIVVLRGAVFRLTCNTL